MPYTALPYAGLAPAPSTARHGAQAARAALQTGRSSSSNQRPSCHELCEKMSGGAGEAGDATAQLAYYRQQLALLQRVKNPGADVAALRLNIREAIQLLEEDLQPAAKKDAGENGSGRGVSTGRRAHGAAPDQGQPPRLR